MKKVIIFALFLVLSIKLIAQTSGKFIYNVFINEDDISENKKNSNIDNGTLKMLNDALNLAERFDYILEFNPNESLYYLDKLMIEDNSNELLLPIAKAMIGKGLYYQNINDKKNIHQVEVLGDLFLISNDLSNDWKITEDKRKIGDYICYKAIKQCESCGASDEVWFTPEIAIPFGPQGYGGLPGLIVEIRRKTFTLTLTKMSYSKNRLYIEEPSKGKAMTLTQFNELTKRYRTTVKEN